MDVTLTADQSAALARILAWIQDKSTPYLVVGGYAGTGKTTLIAYLRRELAERKGKKDLKVAFCSYTGKAASVLRQKLREAQALCSGDTCGTIHSLIYKPQVDDAGRILGWDRATLLGCDLIVIDEGSMVNALIWNDLRSFSLPILVFGDHGQLPPIEGSFYLMQGPHIVLEHIVRQAADNPIIRLSQAIREGKPVPFGSWEGNAAVRKYSLQDSEAMEAFEAAASRPSEEYLCICGTNRTRVGLNRRIRGLKDFEDPEPQRGDRVICLKNNHAKAIYNGMIGRLERIDKEDEHWYEALVRFDDKWTFEGKMLRYQFDRLKTVSAADTDLPVAPREYGDLFDFGYALTAHKAQGSEATRAIVFEERMRMYDDDMWKRWLYTAVTRAREEVLLFA